MIAIAKLLVGGALAESVNTAEAQQSPKVVECIGIADMTSKYLARDLVYYDRPVLQPTAGCSAKGLTVLVFATVILEG